MSEFLPTPRTDAATFSGRDMGLDTACPHFPCVDADFAQSLEREILKQEQTLTQIFRWIERNHPDGFIDSQTYCQNLDRVLERAHAKADLL